LVLLVILRLISALIATHGHYYDSYKIPAGEESTILLKMLIATGRCFLSQPGAPNDVLSMGENRKATIGWKTESNGAQTVQIL
jgi:hypothetical protein